MSLQAIIDQILASGEAQVNAIQEQAAAEIAAILAQAQTQADQRYHAACSQVVKPAELERDRIINQARFEALCRIGNARDQKVCEVITAVEQVLHAARDHPGYQQALQKSLQEVCDQADIANHTSDGVVIEADPRDQPLLEEILRRNGLAVPVEYTLDCWGGVSARSTDGHIRYVNTLEARFERALPYIKHQLTAWFDTQESVEQAACVKEKAHVGL